MVIVFFLFMSFYPIVFGYNNVGYDGLMDSPWPMKCHDTRHTGRSQYSTIENPGFEKWKFKTDKWIEGGSIIDKDGVIYFGCFDNYLYAIYPDGSLKWKCNIGDWIWSTPAISMDGIIYVGAYNSRMHAINPNGTKKWVISTGGTISSSPAIAEDGTIYFGTMRGFDKGDIIAVNPDGTKKWQYETGYRIVSDPAIGDDGTIYIGSGDGYLYAMNPDGSLKWRFKTGDIVKSHPSIADDGTIYFDSFDGYLYALFPNGTLKWRASGGGSYAASASIAEDGTIYDPGNRYLNAYYPNGTIKWKFYLGSSETYIAHSSPAISVDGIIYVGTGIGTSNGGTLIAINPDGTERWRSAKIANLWVRSSPSIGMDGTVYIGSSSENYNGNSYGYLHAFGIGELKAFSNGPYKGLIDFPVQFNGDAIGGIQPYTWHWDFGNGEFSMEKNPVLIYKEQGNYSITLTVNDSKGTISSDTSWVLIQGSNNPPSKPSIFGATEGKTGVEYRYRFTASDPENNDYYFHIKWDNSQIKVIGPFKTGEIATQWHTWNETGSHTVKAMAKDEYGAESDWATLTVTMPKMYSLFSRFPLLEKIFRFKFAV
jgi:outer membrane protein assembly factor BamB